MGRSRVGTQKEYEFWSIDSKIAKEKQEEVRRTSIYEEKLAEKLAGIKETTLWDVASMLGFIKLNPFSGKEETQGFTKNIQNEITDCLRALGFERKILRRDGQRKRIWVKDG